MTNPNSATTQPVCSGTLWSLSARLTIGSAVCFTEGITTSILVALPKNQWAYIGGFIVTFFVWVAFLRYRDTKIGVDVGDLCFYDFLGRGIALTAYANGVDPGMLWYAFTTISMLKLVRVYIWENSATQQYGWRQFGPMTWLYAKRQAIGNEQGAAGNLTREIIIAFAVAIFASCLIRLVPDLGRAILMWFIPVTFEFLIGPIQLRMVRDFSAAMVASNSQEDDKTAENERLKQELAAQKNKNDELKKENDTLRQLHALPKKAHTDLIDAYESTKSARQGHLVKIAQNIAAVFSNKRDS